MDTPAQRVSAQRNLRERRSLSARWLRYRRSVRLSQFTDELAAPVNIPEHGVVVPDGACEIARFPFAIIEGYRILEPVRVLEDLRDRLP